MNQVANRNGKKLGIKKTYYVQNVGAKNIIGSQTKKVMNAKVVVIVKFYEPIWAMMHKIRTAIGNSDSEYQLSGIIELDEDFFSTETPEQEKKSH